MNPPVRYSRFAVPHLITYQGWALFMDGDMLVRDDIANLWGMRDESKALMRVLTATRPRHP